MFSRVTCPICGALPKAAGSKIGHLRTKIYQLARCPHCGSAWVTNADDDYDQIYDEAYYAGKGADPLVDYVAELTDARTARRYEWDGLVQIARDLGVAENARWIDFGGGAGAFARHLKSVGFDAYAFDTGRGIEIARAHDVPVASAALLDTLDGSVDVVSAIEVVEHLADPLGVLQRIARLLRPGGVLILTTGNVARWQKPLAAWGYVMPEVHITFFSPDGLRAVYEATGLEALAVPRSAGWDGVIRYKILKTLRIGRRSILESVLPWSLIARFVDGRYGVSQMPAARKPPSVPSSPEHDDVVEDDTRNVGR